MTIVEFFEKTPFENMISCLTAKPDKVIFLGDTAQMKKTIPVYERFLKNKGYKTKIELRSIDRFDLKAIVQTLTDIVKTEKDCIFDITGGEDLLILGCGIVFATCREEYPFKLQRFDLKNGKIIDCDCHNAVSFRDTVKVSVEELISLYGGVVVPENPQPDTNTDKRDVDLLWNMACADLNAWNDAVKFLKEFEKRTEPDYDKMHINIDLPALGGEILNYRQKLEACTEFLRALAEKGVVTGLWITANRMSYAYKNAVVRRCLKSPGDVLEMKVLFEARNLQENGKPYFNSCYIGVNIDWDGVDRHYNDTKNEIDVILMRGLTPIFISCKIGEIKEIEPYKLWTVAERFGGKHVKKVLIASAFNRENEKSELSFLNRTRDMGITFITNATDMTAEDWKNMLKNLAR
ncbi:MAG: DUF1887 family protein [Oscillospiraceae bacterium]|nr:DUF1887 family protein [Oscillospiraceae bacterium]